MAEVAENSYGAGFFAGGEREDILVGTYAVRTCFTSCGMRHILALHGPD